MRPLRVVIVDDEMAARQRLHDLLDREGGVEVVGSYGDPREAVEAIRKLAPDLVFLDVQMPEMDGLAVVRQVGPERMPPTIFVTAYDRYALNAFELAALDYLLKPFDDERFGQALSRARERSRLRELDRLADQMRTLLGSTAQPEPVPSPADAASGYMERIAVDAQGKLLVIPVEAIDYISAEGPYAELHVGDKRYLIRERMHALEERLDPRRFCRIHRSTIVNLERIASLEPLFRGDYVIRLSDGTRLRLSRSRREELAERLG
ncbi:MAG TPA: LytTR family DNA-binding domain-containing protein, partial [Longimicrobiaceae bacterium]|nr:LytTR family DNA-binding domain-containing protein [Longimicrobiaceae bacterium]